MSLRSDSEAIISSSIRAVLPDVAVRRALAGYVPPSGRLIVVAIGKAAHTMARAALEVVGPALDCGIVITKDGHAPTPLPGLVIHEAGHPLPDARSFAATREALAMTSALKPEDQVLFLVSGGGSALFEAPLVAPQTLEALTQTLLASGASITEINTIRKRMSAVKGGRFALHCAPARVSCIILSDIIGDPLDMIASGPAVADTATCADAKAIAQKYDLPLDDEARRLLDAETPKRLDNVVTTVVGNNRLLCQAACQEAARLGYEPLLLTDRLTCEAREAGSLLASIAATQVRAGKKSAFILGGETVVHLHGQGLGGRNQELALAAAPGLAGTGGACVVSVGSDGTDGPTDAAGGYVDGASLTGALTPAACAAALADNDAYHALETCGGLIKTGPTGTNVCDLSFVLVDPACK